MIEIVASPNLAAIRELPAYWESKRPAGALPGRDDINASEIRRLLPNIIIIAEPVDGGADWITSSACLT